MNLSNSALVLSLLIVWLSVFIKYEAYEFLSHSNIDADPDTESNQYRFRQRISNTFHRIVDPKNQDESDTDSTRLRKKIKDGYRNVADKFRKQSTKQANTPAIPSENNWNENLRTNPKPEVPFNPSEPSISNMAQIAAKIKNNRYLMKDGHHNHDYKNGYYNDYNYRPAKYSSIKGTICKNYLEYNGIIFGKFYCPIEGFSLEDTECCGQENEQHCCLKSTSNSEKSFKDTIVENPVYVFLLILMPAIFFIVFVLCLSFIASRSYKKLPSK